MWRTRAVDIVSFQSQGASMERARIKSIAKEALIWVPTLFLVFVFTMQGFAKFSDSSGWARAFQHWGYPDWFRWTIGFAELLAVAFLLWRRTAALGAALIIIVMIGGIGTHVAAGDRFWWRSEALPILLATIVFLARHSRLRLPYVRASRRVDETIVRAGYP